MSRPKGKLEIFSNDDGWQPSRTLVNGLLKQMAAKGLRSDWQYCHATNDQSLLFDSGESKKPGIRARKTGPAHKWTFFTLDSKRGQGEEL